MPSMHDDSPEVKKRFTFCTNFVQTTQIFLNLKKYIFHENINGFNLAQRAGRYR